MHAVRRGTWINAQRDASKKRAKERLVQNPYTAERLAEIDADYAAEAHRVSEPRYFEEVEVSEVLPQRVKGPLTTTDVVVWHVGWGMQLTPPGTFGLAAKVRRKAPGCTRPTTSTFPTQCSGCTGTRAGARTRSHQQL